MPPSRERPDTYRLGDDPPPRRRYRPMPGTTPPRDEADADRPRDPWWVRFSGLDLFVPILVTALLVWGGVGLAARSWPAIGIVLIPAGIVLAVIGQIWLFAAIYSEDRTSFFWSLVSSWYRAIYVHLNPEIGWRPFVLMTIGVLMMFTGVGLGWTFLHR